jgi:hypothetical protein
MIESKKKKNGICFAFYVRLSIKIHSNASILKEIANEL